jgi:hypothetical protein
MSSKLTPSSSSAAIRDRLAKEDAAKSPEKGMEMLRRGHAENQLREAAKKGRRKEPPSPDTIPA